MGTSLWSGIAMRTIWRGPPTFYPVQTSSALESCRFLACLPSSRQVVSESHPAAICHWLGLPPEILEKNMESSLLLVARASMEAQFTLFPSLKETASGLNSEVARMTGNNELFSGGNYLKILIRGLKWSNGQHIKCKIFQPALSSSLEVTFCCKRNVTVPCMKRVLLIMYSAMYSLCLMNLGLQNNLGASEWFISVNLR